MVIRERRAIIAAAGLAVIIGAPLIFKGGQWQQQRARQSHCMSNLKQIGLGTQQYVRDYDEHMPLAKNWSETLFPYVKSDSVFQCPQRGTAPQGYAFYRDAQQMSWTAFPYPSKMILFFDSDGPKLNTADTGASLPRPPRHPDGHALGYHDGHVKMILRPNLQYGYDAVSRKRHREALVAETRREAESRKKRNSFEFGHPAPQKKPKKPPRKHNKLSLETP
ncbi:MAG TPA: hypothetical protein VF719_11955 [Abditibacteriaceae bacterium]|jgi:hypothetical protein